MLTSRADPEAHALALKIADAVKAGSGAMPSFSDALPSPPPGVVLVLRARDADPGRAFVDTVGRVLMAARIAVISDKAIDVGDNTVRIVVGGKPYFMFPVIPTGAKRSGGTSFSQRGPG